MNNIETMAINIYTKKRIIHLKIEKKIIIIIYIDSKIDSKKFLKHDYLINFELGITFKTIPKSFKGYWLYISFKTENIIVLPFFILYKYSNAISFNYILCDLTGQYKWQTGIISFDMEKAQIDVINNLGFLEYKPTIILCFFHYSQNIIRKMKKINIIRSKELIKGNVEIFRNLQLLSFVKKENVKLYFEKLKFIVNKSQKEKKINAIL